MSGLFPAAGGGMPVVWGVACGSGCFAVGLLVGSGVSTFGVVRAAKVRTAGGVGGVRGVWGDPAGRDAGQEGVLVDAAL